MPQKVSKKCKNQQSKEGSLASKVRIIEAHSLPLRGLRGRSLGLVSFIIGKATEIAGAGSVFYFAIQSGKQICLVPRLLLD
ncbi:MAG: hypothetical protein DLD55_05630 [candidate division SR1 bacterium]|nr:MAG: hypothetical protein DLD55_05630 [candidate division SR1 bacterium]